jgi:hypothetical protein
VRALAGAGKRPGGVAADAETGSGRVAVDGWQWQGGSGSLHRLDSLDEAGVLKSGV